MREAPDSSVLIPALAQWHPKHLQARAALADVNVVIAHVLVETFSVLTRLPAPHRVSPADAAAAVAGLPWKAIALEPEAHGRLVADAGRFGIAGGAVYDALIAATAKRHGVTVLTRDQRSRRTYERLGADYRLIRDQ